MPEESQTPDEVQIPGDSKTPGSGEIPESKATAKPKGYLSTTRGKIVAGVVVGLLLVFIVTMALAFVLILRQAPPAEEAPSQPTEKPTGAKGTTTATTPSTTPTSPTTTTATQPSPAPGPPEAYKYKDPFEPQITTQPAGATTGTTSTATTTTTTATTATTDGLPITLISIPAGGSSALFRYGPSLYTVKAGQRIGASPYQVLSIGPASVTLLYGDDRIELDLGEQIAR